MRSKVLLISANRCATPDPVFPLGLAHLSSALRRAGHDCAWVDFLVDGERLAQILTDYRPDLVGVSLRNIDDVLIRKREVFFENLSSLCLAIREQISCPIVLGGSGFSIFPERLMEMAQADFGLQGEGEPGLLALLEALAQGRSYCEIPGLVFRENGRLIRNAPAAGTAAFAELAPADRPQPVVDYYLRTGGMLNVQTQRGCAHACCYCTYPVIEGREHRRRPPEVVAAEFEQLQRLGARYAFIVDSVFNSSPRHVTEICEALLRRNVKLSWGCFLRPQGLTPELMRLMARAGLAHIEFGSDSFCDDVLAAYQKHFTFDDILRSSELARNENVDFCHFIIAGGPGETPATLERGFAHAQRLNGAVVLAVVGMRIYPGTALFAQAVAEGQIAPNADLLSPAYYLAPGLSAETVFAHLQDFAQRAPNWIVGDPDPAYQKLVQRLRHRGVVGPLWSYFSMMQRLNPRALAQV